MDTVWDQIYEASRSKTELPHPEIQGVLDLFNRHQVRRVLDLGCGTRRHLIAFAREGFDTWGLGTSAPDSSKLKVIFEMPNGAISKHRSINS